MTTTLTPGAARVLAERYAADLTAKFANERFAPKFHVSPGGTRFARVFEWSMTPGAQRFVHCFVDLRNGDLLKDAGWAGPAAGARGNLATDEGYAAALDAADRFGSYLYRR